MRNLKMWVFLMAAVIVLGLAEAGRDLPPHPLFDTLSREELVHLAGYGEEKLSTVLITGSVFCPDHEASAPLRPVSGVRVGITCNTIYEKTKTYSLEETTTDEYGDFTLYLPSHLHGFQNIDRACQVKVIQGSMEHSKAMIKLASARNGIRTYTTGKIYLKGLETGKRSSMASAIIRFAKIPIDKWRG